jgi:hypothetical protein
MGRLALGDLKTRLARLSGKKRVWNIRQSTTAWQLMRVCRYQRAWIDFLEDQLVQFGYDWRELLDDFLYSGKQPLINNLIAGRKLLCSLE